MTCDFMFFSTVIQSYQDDGRVIMIDCVKGNPFTAGKISDSEPPDQLGSTKMTELLGPEF